MSRAFVIKCDTCPTVSHEMNTDNAVTAQKILVEYHHWKVYQTTEGLPKGQLYEWKRACPRCVQAYAIAISKAKRKKANS